MEKNKYYVNIENFAAENTDNPDLMKFSATVGFLDTPTDATPCGGLNGYKTVISSEGTDVQSLVGMGVNVAYGWGDDFKSHDRFFKIGVINSVHMEGNEIKAEGHLWKCDFPDICDTIECAKESLGCSVEVWFEKIVEDKDNMNIIGKNAHFTGVAILYKSKAAFTKTSIMCAIKEQEEKNLNEEIQKALKEQNDAVEEKFSAVNEAISKLTASVEALSAKKDDVADEAKVSADDVDSKAGFDFEAFSKAIVDGVVGAINSKADSKADDAASQNLAANSEDSSVDASANRKTVADFGSQKQCEGNEEKTLMELCAEVDADNSLSDGQKWSKKLALWNAENAKN